jgi:hypothetical protein
VGNLLGQRNAHSGPAMKNAGAERPPEPPGDKKKKRSPDRLSAARLKMLTCSTEVHGFKAAMVGRG